MEPIERDSHALPKSEPKGPKRDTHHRPPAQKGGATKWIGIALLVGLGAYVGIAPRLQQRKRLATAQHIVEETPALVSVVKPVRATGGGTLTLPGTLQAIEETTINARAGGYLTRRYVDIGSRVKAGQLLAEIQSPELDQQVAQAQSEATKAQAGYGQAQAEAAKLKAGVTQARSEVSRTMANAEQARADLAHLEAKKVEANAAHSVAMSRLIQADKRLTGLKAERERAKTRQHLAQVTLDRWQALLKQEAVSGQETDEKQADYDTATSGVEAAEAAVSSAEADVKAAQETVRSSGAEEQAAEADCRSGRQKVKSAEAAVESSRSNVEASQAGASAGVSNVAAAGATISANRANMRRYAALQSFEKIVAPFSGVITARNVDVGALIGTSAAAGSDPNATVPKTGLFGLARTDVLRVQVQVPQNYVPTIREGQQARILFREYAGRIFTGTVARLSGALDAASRTLLVELHVSNPDGILKPGMYAQVQFSGLETAKQLRIPAGALLTTADGLEVVTVTPDNRLHFQKIKTGRDFGKEVEIVEGLRGNESLVANPDDNLQEGQTVRRATAPAL